ncbi:unnamed protein product [Rotaria sordida]|uniref:C2 domain-containing protein n=1 Tax=Rotaria sordida TaxID=392033 RepID=A0A815KY64_9BILA|nr:unnamed protein product [Rotaria sordida]CAF1402452.1 unnamed protein product [Rotaria sordida]CAF3614841.1 unnamed protein product [Rotaria sordida]CAF3657532.1 unnamed protein product [Rotaria sordida]
MAKLGSFIRRLFSSFTSDNDCPSSPTLDTRKNIVVISSLTSSSQSSVPTATTIIKPSQLISHTSRSCSTSPRSIIKQTTMQIDSNKNGNSNSNFLSSNTNKCINRRLSAPLIIHASTHHHHHNLYRSAIVDETIEQALISPLQRLSLSSTAGTSIYNNNNSVNSLGASGGSISGSPHNDVHSSPLNLSLSTSSFLPSSLNHISSTSGTPPTQFTVGPSSSSPRVSLQSNNSASPNSDRNMSSQTRGRRPSMFDPIDPKELQQALYASAAAKANLPSNPSNEDELTRPLSHITISYDHDIGHVIIDSLSFENLHILDSYINNNNNSDFISFYCRFRLLPEKRSLFQTKIIRLTRLQSSYLFDKKQLNEFELTHDQLNNHSIEIFLYKISIIKPLYKDIRIATVKYDLNELSETDQNRIKKSLDECDPSSIIQDPDLGELLLSLSYLQSAGKLSVVIIEAKNLRPLSIETKSYPDACVKVTLYDRNGKKLKRKKTSVQRTSDCPTFNEEFVFELRRDIASEVMIELRLVHESLSYKEQLGSVIFGPIINHMMKGPLNPENIYWSTILSGQSLNAQWQILKPSIKIEELK